MLKIQSLHDLSPLYMSCTWQTAKNLNILLQYALTKHNGPGAKGGDLCYLKTLHNISQSLKRTTKPSVDY